MSDIKDLRARYNASGNAVIPNTFQHPNIFVDKLMCYLTPEENVVLTFAVRRILGFQGNIMSRKDNISLSQFTDGFSAADGTPLCYGCGLGTDSVRKALESLCAFKILLPTTEKPDPRKGQEYWLQDNENVIDWAKLEERKEAKRQIEYQRTQKARCTVAQQGTVAQEPRGTVAQKARVLSHSNTKPTETHGNPNNGAQIAPFPLDWQIAVGQKEIIMPTEDQQFKADCEIATTNVCKGAQNIATIAHAFMVHRHLLPTKSQYKGWRAAFLEMYAMGVRPEHIQEALQKLASNNMTVADPFAVRKTAIALANPMPETPPITVQDAAI